MRSVMLRFPDGKSKALTFSYDDGVPQDLRLAQIFDKYGMKCTFNFNCEKMRPNYNKDEIREHFLSKGHEIAVHGANHRANGNCRAIEGIIDVLDCRLELEEKCDAIIRGMAYPDTGIGRMNGLVDYEKIKNYLTELDIAYARAAKSEATFELPTDFHAWAPTAHHNHPDIFKLIDEFLAIDTSPKAYHSRRYPRLFYVWGHSFEFDSKDNWDVIEKICEKFHGNEDVWCATNIEIYDYVQAYKSLRYSANGKKVFNPTLLTVWLDVDSRLIKIPSGETVILE